MGDQKCSYCNNRYDDDEPECACRVGEYKRANDERYADKSRDNTLRGGHS